MSPQELQWQGNSITSSMLPLATTMDKDSLSEHSSTDLIEVSPSPLAISLTIPKHNNEKSIMDRNTTKE